VNRLRRGPARLVDQWLLQLPVIAKSEHRVQFDVIGCDARLRSCVLDVDARRTPVRRLLKRLRLRYC
jgi:hypothetical protein